MAEPILGGFMPAKKLRDFLEKQRKEGVKEQFS
jgi:hypothetical protein